MDTIFTLALREMTRLRSRFTGRVRPLVTLILASTLLLAYLTFQQGAIRGRGLYRVGVSPDGPPIQDSRFNTVSLERAAGYAALEAGQIDMYIDGNQVINTGSDKSLYATGALKLYLENQELARIAEQYEPEQAFPLRLELNTFPVDLAAQGRIIVPSLMRTPVPFAQVVTVSLYLFPIFLVSVFFVSGFMDEKTERRISVLLSAPVSPFQIIAGKMLPYIIFAMAAILVITVMLHGDLLLAALIFAPVILFIFSIYLMVPLVYRTFKDTTFISMLATTGITAYLIFPAMFSGVSDLSYVSPLTLAVKMYSGRTFGLKEYLTSTASMYLVFALAVYVGGRILNEDYLMRFRPMHRKAAEAIYLALQREHIYLSILLLSLFLVPIVYMVQLASLAVSFNLPLRYAKGVLLIAAVLIEETAKSVGIVTLLQNKDIQTVQNTLILSFLSALGFLIGEKGLLFISINFAANSMLAAAMFEAGQLWIPLLAHTVFTAIVCMIVRQLGARRYVYALAVGSVVHVAYNLYVLGVIG